MVQMLRVDYPSLYNHPSPSLWYHLSRSKQHYLMDGSIYCLSR